MPWNNIIFPTQLFIALSEKDMDTKVEALKKYKSQESKPYANELFIRSLARTRGVCIETEYAEAFEVVRWVIK